MNIISRFVFLLIVSVSLAIALGKDPEDGNIAIDPSPTLITKTYDIHDMLIWDFEGAPHPDLSRVTSTPAPEEALPQTPEQIAKDIAQKIRNTVQYSSWEKYGKIEIDGSRLIISQTPDTQDQIAALLNQLRKSRSMHVKIQATVIRVDKPDKITEALAVKSNRYGANMATIGKAKFPATEAGTLLQELRGDKNINIVDASFDFHSGLGQYVLNGNSFPYVAGVDATRVKDQESYKKLIANCTLGVLVDLERGICAADHQNVTMDLTVQWSRLQWLEDVVVPADRNLDYQRPLVSLSELKSRITVPTSEAVLFAMKTPSLVILQNDAKSPTTQPTVELAKNTAQSPQIYLLIQPGIVEDSQPAEIHADATLK